MQAAGASVPAAYSGAPATPAKRPKSNEPRLRPKEEYARFVMRLNSHGSSSDELPVNVSGSHQKAEKDGDHRHDFAPLVDHIEFLGDRTSGRPTGPLLTCSESSSLPATIFRQMNSAITMAVTTIQRATNGRKSRFTVDLQIRVHNRICGPGRAMEPADGWKLVLSKVLPVASSMASTTRSR